MSSLFLGWPRFAAGLASACVAALSSPAVAGPAPSYEELLARALQSPAAMQADAVADAAQARVRQAASRPNPELAVEMENFAGGGAYGGFRSAETSVSLTQPLEIWGARTARVDVAQAEADAAALRRMAERLALAQRLAAAYAEAEAAQKRLALAEEGLSLTQEDENAAQALVEEGREPALRALQAAGETASAVADRDAALAEQAAAFAALGALSAYGAGLDAVVASLLDRTPPSPGDIGDTPEILIARAEREAVEHRVRQARISGKPDLSASIGARRFADDDVTALTAGVAVEIPFFDSKAGDVAAARAELRAADAHVQTLVQLIAAERVAALARLTAASGRIAAADAGVASAQEAYRLSRIGYEAGRIALLELRSARAALITTQNAALDARMARVRAEIDLARLEGRFPYGSEQ